RGALRREGNRLNELSASATAVIAAAGAGERLGAGGAKALVPVAGRPLLAWSLAAIGAAERVSETVVAAPPGDLEAVERICGDQARVVAGGASRSESVAAAAAGASGEIVVVHDAARPLAPPELFDGIVAALAADPQLDALIAAIPLTDTVKRCDPETL